MRDRGEYLFTSESVSEGHPDKVADRISDTVLDAFLTADPYARVACETWSPPIASCWPARPAARKPSRPNTRASRAHGGARYRLRPGGFSGEAEIECHLHAQSADIAQGVDAAGNKDEGAGDQGIMFGYACRETEGLMPAPLYYAHLILRRISELRRNKEFASPACCRTPRAR